MRRKPVLDWEIPQLERFGAELGRLRGLAGLSREQLAQATGVSRVHISRLERAQRRPRRSTIARMVRVLVASHPPLGDPDSLTGWLVDLCGDAIALESQLVERIEKRRDRQVRRMQVELVSAAPTQRSTTDTTKTLEQDPPVEVRICVRLGCTQPATRGRLCEPHHWY